MTMHDVPAGQPLPRGVRLGVDVGMARVGVAGSDPDCILATPIRTLKRDPRRDSDIGVLVREARERGAVQIFVGLTRTMKGGESESTRVARDYAGRLVRALTAADLQVSVNLVDERLTTVTAHRSLHNAGVGSREHRRVVDQVAAVEILQQAIDMQRSLGRDVGTVVPPPAGGRTAGNEGPGLSQEEHYGAGETQ
ncbi:Holliday junction resolvase RuvX [Arthrobacter deserti]|uniref:Putative pre-16S rRNA nuclease n=1 Tax=Arthrobacter deserti TaxID=1742687 RepID=A0ABX1JKL1_9MICC|nr:Holliday junction resolvase RuvX [Arthrobacter deserti]